MERTVTAESATSVDSPGAEGGAESRAGLGAQPDPHLVITSCANCGAQMLDRKCKLICDCGYFLSCSDYY